MRAKKIQAIIADVVERQIAASTQARALQILVPGALEALITHVTSNAAMVIDAELDELTELRAVADPDNETPELSLRERIMHIGEQAALLTSVTATCDRARSECKRLRALLDRKPTRKTRKAARKKTATRKRSRAAKKP